MLCRLYSILGMMMCITCHVGLGLNFLTASHIKAMCKWTNPSLLGFTKPFVRCCERPRLTGPTRSDKSNKDSSTPPSPTSCRCSSTPTGLSNSECCLGSPSGYEEELKCHLSLCAFGISLALRMSFRQRSSFRRSSSPWFGGEDLLLC